MSDEQNFEMHISVNESVEALATIVGARLYNAEDPDGPVRYTEVDAQRARFTIFAYRDRPAWSHLLCSEPFDHESIVTFLSQLGVHEDKIDVSLDVDMMPLQDIDAIRAGVANLRRRTRH